MFKLLLPCNARFLQIGSNNPQTQKNAVHRAIVPNASHMLLSVHAVHISRPIVLHLVIVKDKVNVPRPRRVVPDEVLVAWWPLLLRVAREHALQTDADALHVVYGTPAGFVEKVEADNAVGVDVWVPRYGVCVVLDEDDFGSLVYGQ
jgi:hypothetical protein